MSSSWQLWAGGVIVSWSFVASHDSLSSGVSLPASLGHRSFLASPQPSSRVQPPWVSVFEGPLWLRFGLHRVQDNLPISGSLTWSHQQSPFDHVCKSWGQDVDLFGAAIQPPRKPTSRSHRLRALGPPRSSLGGRIALVERHREE